MRILVWFVLGLIGVCAVAGILGAGPERMRVLLLFPVIFGALAGAALGWAAREMGLRNRLLTAALSGLMVAAGLVVVGLAAYRELASLARLRMQQDPQQLTGLLVVEEVAQADPSEENVRAYRARRLAVDPRFGDYLHGRVSGLGDWPDPWPSLFWLTEILLGGLTAEWIVWRILGRGSRRGPRTGNPTPQDAGSARAQES